MVKTRSTPKLSKNSNDGSQHSVDPIKERTIELPEDLKNEESSDEDTQAILTVLKKVIEKKKSAVQQHLKKSMKVKNLK